MAEGLIQLGHGGNWVRHITAPLCDKLILDSQGYLVQLSPEGKGSDPLKQTADEPEAEAEGSAGSEVKVCGIGKGTNEWHGGLYPRAATAQVVVGAGDAGRVEAGSHEVRNDGDETKELGATEMGMDASSGCVLFDVQQNWRSPC